MYACVWLIIVLIITTQGKKKVFWGCQEKTCSRSESHQLLNDLGNWTWPKNVNSVCWIDKHCSPCIMADIHRCFRVLLMAMQSTPPAVGVLSTWCSQWSIYFEWLTLAKHMRRWALSLSLNYDIGYYHWATAVWWLAKDALDLDGWQRFEGKRTLAWLPRWPSCAIEVMDLWFWYGYSFIRVFS